MTEKGIFWVTRIRGNAKYHVLDERKSISNKAILYDKTIKYSSEQRDTQEFHPIRLIGYRDKETGQDYEFITNHFHWSAQTVADIYKQRWQVELFFKWIKQNLKIKSFLGNSKNAVLTQILSALCVYLLVSYLKFENKFRQSLQQVCRLLHTNLFARRSIYELFSPPEPKIDISPQMVLSLARR